MEQVIRRFNIITLRPHWAQYIISQGLMFLVSMVLFLVAGHEAITFKAPFLILGTITTDTWYHHNPYDALRLSVSVQA